MKLNLRKPEHQAAYERVRLLLRFGRSERLESGETCVKVRYDGVQVGSIFGRALPTRDKYWRVILHNHILNPTCPSLRLARATITTRLVELELK